jgi:hypothetical protein
MQGFRVPRLRASSSEQAPAAHVLQSTVYIRCCPNLFPKPNCFDRIVYPTHLSHSVSYVLSLFTRSRTHSFKGAPFTQNGTGFSALFHLGRYHPLGSCARNAHFPARKSVYSSWRGCHADFKKVSQHLQKRRDPGGPLKPRKLLQHECCHWIASSVDISRPRYGE